MKVIDLILSKPLLKAQNEFIHEEQMGQQPGKGVCTQLTRLRRDIADFTKEKKQRWVVMIDLSKAYQSVDRNRFHEICRNNNLMSDDEIKVHKFISDRTRISYGDPTKGGKSTKTKIGFNQGTASSGWAFNIAINDIIDELRKSNREVYLFCDDILILTDSKNDAKLVWNQVKDWCNNIGKMKVNKKKCAVMKIGRQEKKPTSISNDIERVFEYKYLGINLNSKLEMKKDLKIIKGRNEFYSQQTYAFTNKSFK